MQAALSTTPTTWPSPSAPVPRPCARGIPHAQLVAGHGMMFVVRRINLHYQRPARLDEVIRIRTGITQVNGASVTLVQHFWRDSDSLAVLEVGLGCVRASDGRASRIPAAWVLGLKS